MNPPLQLRGHACRAARLCFAKGVGIRWHLFLAVGETGGLMRQTGFDPMKDRHPPVGSRAEGSYWLATAGPPAVDDGVLLGATEVDVAVVGAGYTGLSAAIELRRGGASVAVLEAATPGYGCSGRNGSFLRPAFGKASYASWIKRYGADMAKAVFDEALTGYYAALDLIRREEIACEAEVCGFLKLAHSPKQVAALKAERDLLALQFGFSVELLEGRALSTRGIAGAEAFAGLRWAQAHKIHPLKLVQGLLGAARKNGALVYQSSPVLTLEKAAGQWILRTPQGEIRADKVIMATNGYGNQALHPAFRGVMVAFRSNITVTAPVPLADLRAAGLGNPEVMIDTRKLSPYWRVLPDGRVMYGARARPRDSKSEQDRLERANLRGIMRKYPGLSGLKPAYSWGGWVAFPRRFMPHSAFVDGGEGVILTGGYCGSGVSYSLRAGMLAASQALNARWEAPDLLRRFPKAYPLHGLHRIGQEAVIALWKIQDRL